MSEEPKAGRPWKYDPKYCDDIVPFMKEGFSIGAFAGHVGVSRRTVTNWVKEFPDFAEAIEAGKAACQLWWEERGRDIAVTGGTGRYPVMTIFALKNMAPDDWREKIEHSGSVGVQVKPLTDDDDAL